MNYFNAHFCSALFSCVFILYFILYYFISSNLELPTALLNSISSNENDAYGKKYWTHKHVHQIFRQSFYEWRRWTSMERTVLFLSWRWIIDIINQSRTSKKKKILFSSSSCCVCLYINRWIFVKYTSKYIRFGL